MVCAFRSQPVALSGFADFRLSIGSLARIGPNDLVTSDPELWMHMSAVRSNYSRAPWYAVGTRVQGGKDTIFSQVDEEKHKTRRQQLAPGVRVFPPPRSPGAVPLTYQPTNSTPERRTRPSRAR